MSASEPNRVKASVIIAHGTAQVDNGFIGLIGFDGTFKQTTNVYPTRKEAAEKALAYYLQLRADFLKAVEDAGGILISEHPLA